MAKIYPFKYHRWSFEKHGRVILPMNENLWFKEHQSLLVAMANHPDGRALLCIDKNLPPVIEVAKNRVTCLLDIKGDGTVVKLHDFRIGAKWANVIRYRWKEFLRLAREFYSHKELGLHQHDVSGLKAATLSTFYPDADPESTTVDGRAGWSVANTNGDIWATARSNSGNTSLDSDTINAFQVLADTGSGDWRSFIRAIMLFDASALSGTIKTSTLSLYATTVDDDFTSDMVICSSNPASDTAIVDADGDIGNFGTTEFTDSRTTLAGITTSAYNDFVMNTAGIAHTSGIVKFGWLAGEDFDNIEPSWVSGDQSLVVISSADETGTSQDPKLVVVEYVTPSPLTLTSTMPDPTIASTIIITPDALPLTTTMPQAFAQVVLVPVDTLTLTTTMPTAVVDAPIIVAPDALMVTVSMPDPTIASQTALISVHDFPSGKTVSYKLVDEFSVVLQDWTSVGVIEEVIDVTADTSVYYTKSNLVSGTSQLLILWKTDDALPLTASTDVDIYLSKVVGIEEDVATKLDVEVSTRAPKTATDFIQKWIDNKLEVSDTLITLYDDDGTTPLRTWVRNATTNTRSKAT